MSHFTKVKTRIRNREQLIKALLNLGHDVEERSQVRGWAGATRKADVVAVQPTGHDVGFTRLTKDADYECVADWMGTGLKQDVFLGEVQQEYALVGAETAAKKAGWSGLTRQRQEDGTIVLTGQRMSGLSVSV